MIKRFFFWTQILLPAFGDRNAAFQLSTTQQMRFKNSTSQLMQQQTRDSPLGELNTFNPEARPCKMS